MAHCVYNGRIQQTRSTSAAGSSQRVSGTVQRDPAGPTGGCSGGDGRSGVGGGLARQRSIAVARARTGARAGTGACLAAGGGRHRQLADVLVRLESDDVQLWTEQTDERYRRAQRYRYAQSGQLHLQQQRIIYTVK